MKVLLIPPAYRYTTQYLFSWRHLTFHADSPNQRDVWSGQAIIDVASRIFGPNGCDV